nr:PD-(D/E)XK nuclease family protein [Brevibacterium sp. R8603A2]
MPILGRVLDRGFNVFDVMHHGTHEKQISNVFGWLLDSGGSHDLGRRFIAIFVDAVNSAAPGAMPFPTTGYRVRQEVNTSSSPGEADIADLVLDSSAARIVVENFHTSDGHGHSFEKYEEYSTQDGRRGTVVLLCRDEDRSRLSHGWENSRVLTYSMLIDRLLDEVAADRRYRRENPESFSFLEQLHRKFVTERSLVRDRDVLRFVTALSDTGEAERYGWIRQEEAAEQFASELAVQARQRFLEGRQLLHTIKSTLRAFSAGPLKDQLNATLEQGRVGTVSARYAGIYQWTINFDIEGLDFAVTGPLVQLKFGPSAWTAMEKDPDWRDVADPENADYSYVYVTRRDYQVIRRTTVSLEEVLDGLEPTDRRLHDAIISVLEAGSH